MAERPWRNAIEQSSRKRSITGTFWSGPVALTVVGRNKADCREDAARCMGEWDTEVWSTPQSIYNDLTGVTAARQARKGEHHNAHQDGLWND